MTSILYVTVQLLARSLPVSGLIFVDLSVIAYNVSSSAAFCKVEASHQFIPTGIAVPFPASTYFTIDSTKAHIKL